MQTRCSNGVWLLVIGAAFCARAAHHLPPADEVVRRIVERSHSVASAVTTNHYVYEKRTVVAELDPNDAVLKSTEKLYQVVLIRGLPFPRLVKVQGRELTAKQLEKENQRETEFRRKAMRVDLEKKSQRKEGLATRELVNRFEFKVIRREVVEGRPTLALTFKPKASNSESSIEDKVYNRLSGTVWVDEQEAEIAKLDANVHGPIPLGWFGAVGSLNRLHAMLERTRMPDGVWVNRRSNFLIVARKLFSVIRSKTSEESSGFRLQ